jgi:hypothetical protein
MGIWNWFTGQPKDIDRDPNEFKCVGRGYQSKHYEEQPPANIQYEQLDEDGTVYWLNDEE